MVSRRKLIAVAVALSPALWISPLEQTIRTERTELKYGGAPVTLKVRQTIGQGMAIGLLAGFRGVVADFLWILNENYWEHLWRPKTDRRLIFVRMYNTMTTVSLLQPHATLFWEQSAWHMAWNIGYAARLDQGLKADWYWRLKAEQHLLDGLNNNPNTYRLYYYIGWLYLHKLERPADAAEYFRRAAEFPDAPSFTARLCARALEKCGQPQAAYEYWKKLWNNGNIRRFHDTIDMRSTAHREIVRLEGELKIPPAQRIFPAGTAS